MRRWGLATVLAVPAVVLALAPARGAEHGVRVVNNAYQPATVTIAPGDTVVWTQEGSSAHSVTADDGSFDSSPACPPVCMTQGNTFRHTFGSAGTFPYYCRIHGRPGGGGMSGTVVVQAAATTTTAPPVATTAAPTTTVLRVTTTARAAATTTTTTVAPTSTTSSSTTTSTSVVPDTTPTSTLGDELAADDDSGDDDDGASVALILLAILTVAGVGGAALWRLRPRPDAGLPPDDEAGPLP